MTNEKIYRWYVYELIDPRTDLVFYVGKGSGNRIDHHEKETLRGVCSKKINKIKSIINKKLAIKKQKIAYFCDEQMAYDYETDRIDFYGLENLTNVMAGGQKAWERRKHERRSRVKQNNEPLDKYLERCDSDKLFSMFAFWFKSGLCNGLKLKCESISSNFKYHAYVT